MLALEPRFRQLCQSGVLPVTGRRIVVGVSGGIDSMALVHLLAGVRDEFALTLMAAYIDHGLRPGETPAEWECVRAAADRMGIESARRFVDVRGTAAQQKISLEHAARQLRYQALAELGRAWGGELLAVAHTADDQAEELLLRLLRGGGRRALSGMRICSGTLVRPLLSFRKAELTAYLAENAIVHCHDSSNDDLRHLRNRVRHELLPLLEQRFDPGVRQSLLKTGDILAEEEDFFSQLVARHWEEIVSVDAEEENGKEGVRLARAPFRLLHSALQRRLTEQILIHLGGRAAYEQIMAVLEAARGGQPGNELHLSGGLRVRVEREALLFSYPLGKGPWRGRLVPP